MAQQNEQVLNPAQREAGTEENEALAQIIEEAICRAQARILNSIVTDANGDVLVGADGNVIYTSLSRPKEQ